MQESIAIYIIAPLLTALTIIVLKPFAKALDLIDVPNHRKLHNGEVPLTGGIAVFIGFTYVLISLGFFDTMAQTKQILFMCFLFIMFIGVLDDLYELSVKTRLVGQMLVSLLFIFGTETYISNLGNLFSEGNVILGPGLGVLITMLAMMGAMNIYNMIDGMDGLLCTVSVSTLGFMSVCFYIAGLDMLFTLTFALILILVSFFIFNVPSIHRFKYKVFMGDAGSLLIGFIIGWLLVEGSQSVNGTNAFKPEFALYLIGLPLMDMVAIIIRRILRGDSPFEPDHQHIHHLLLRFGVSENASNFIIPLIAIFIMSSGVLVENFAPTMLFEVFLTIFVVYLVATKLMLRKIEKREL